MSYPVTDKAYSTAMLAAFEGDPELGTFSATIQSSGILVPMPDWDRYARSQTVGPYDATAFLAEWLTLSIECSSGEVAATELTLWLGGSEFPTAITPRVTLAYDASLDAWKGCVNFNSVATSLDISGAKSVQVFGYTNTGSVLVKFISVSYSPK